MTQPADRRTPGAGGPVSYLERLRTPLWWYLAALGVAALLGAEFGMAVSGWLAWVPLVILVPVCLLVVWRLSSGTIVVAGQVLRVGDRELALSDIAVPIVLSATELRRLVGRHGDPLAYNFIRSWVGPGIQLVLTDRRADPTGQDEWAGSPAEPYWLISSRRPDRLLHAIEAAVSPAAAGGAAVDNTAEERHR